MLKGQMPLLWISLIREYSHQFLLGAGELLAMDMSEVSELLLFMHFKRNLTEIILAGKVSCRRMTPRDVVAAPGSLAVTKARMDGAGSTLGQWKVTLPMAGG